jgi:hypothetical protein
MKIKRKQIIKIIWAVIASIVILSMLSFSFFAVLGY